MSMFHKHPHENGMTYREHFVFAMRVGWRMTFAGIACMFHAIIPFCFETSASKCVDELNKKFETHTNESLNSTV